MASKLLENANGLSGVKILTSYWWPTCKIKCFENLKGMENLWTRYVNLTWASQQ